MFENGKDFHRQHISSHCKQCDKVHLAQATTVPLAAKINFLPPEVCLEMSRFTGVIRHLNEI